MLLFGYGHVFSTNVMRVLVRKESWGPWKSTLELNNTHKNDTARDT